MSVRRITSSRCCRPREGCGLHRRTIVVRDDVQMLPSPRGVRVASCNLNFDDGAKAPLPSPRGARAVSTAPLCTAPQAARCCPREGCGLHQQKDTNPYQHICRFHTTRRLSITQGQQKMQGVLCLLYRKRECNLIVGSANRLFLRDKNAREKQRLAGNC